jgi:hypothetical protein
MTPETLERVAGVADLARAVAEVFELLGGRYARAARATEGRMDPVPGCRELVIELDALWEELSRLGPSDE